MSRRQRSVRFLAALFASVLLGAAAAPAAAPPPPSAPETGAALAPSEAPSLPAAGIGARAPDGRPPAPVLVWVARAQAKPPPTTWGEGEPGGATPDGERAVARWCLAHSTATSLP